MLGIFQRRQAPAGAPVPSDGRGPQAPPGGTASRWPRPIASFASADFRWLFLSSLLGTTGNWMENVVRNIVVYDLTDSALALGLVNSTRAVAALPISLVGGVLADRMDRKTLLAVAQGIHGCCGLTLGLLIVAGVIAPWHFAVIAFIEGAVGSIQQPARQALVPSVVPRHLLLNAITLNGSIWRISRTGAPALAALMTVLAGPASALFLEAGLYACGVYAIQRVRFGTPVAAPGGDGSSQWDGPRGRQGWIEGFRGYGYVRENPVVGALILLALVPIVFGFANMALAPIFAKDVLHIGPGGVGLLLSAPGVGSIFATILLASAGDVRRKGLLTFVGIAIMGVAATVYGLSSWVWLSLGALVLHGFAMAGYQTLNQTLVQLHTPDEYRGRVMAVYHMDRSFHPVSLLMVAALADLWGAQVAVALSGIACVVTVIVVLLLARGLRSLD